ncbi:MAG: hypothetical protein BA864_06020 [Desulfuromonadales bacterium C00003093]|nr:MAG: hypothetical protein BA864_06020 [Desulfuromonadales bacterium C00003093]
MLTTSAGGAPLSENAEVRVAVSRDTWVSSFHDEQDANLGGANRLKTKGIQEFSIIDLSPEQLRGRVITRATLHLHCRSEAPLRRVTVSTLAADWVEGTATRYRTQVGSASFNWAAQSQTPWAWPGSDITAVMNGLGHTIWRFADASPPDNDNWQSISVDPAVVSARVAGLSYGFVIFDDVGNEYQRNGEQVIHQPMRNRFHSSREAGAGHAPYFTIQLGPEDVSVPQAVTNIHSESLGLPAGEGLISWETPADKGPSGTLGFHVRFTDTQDFVWDSATEVPRYLIPMADKPGDCVTLHLRDLQLAPGQQITIGIRAVDRTGNMGSVQTAKVRLAEQKPKLVLPAPPPLPKAGDTDQLPTVGDLNVFIIDSLDKVDPLSGAMTPPHEHNYRLANHLWLAAKRQVRLFSARKETVSFQLVVQGKTEGLQAAVAFDDKGTSSPQSELFSFRHVKGKKGRLLPDPLVPLNEPLRIPFAEDQLSRQNYASLIIDIHIPKTARPGMHKGALTLTSGEDTLTLDIALKVWNFTLPDTLSFIPQMNGYGRVPEADHELAYYRLAHRHRTCLNILPYGWTGRIADNRAPKWDGENFDWEAYDQRFGPLLDGSAFADLPRGPIPVEAFYLPLNENWPINIHEAFVGGYWIEDALKPEYRQQFVAAVRKYAEHIQAKGWNGNMFEFYLNNKISHKKSTWKGSSAPWNFDEPVNTQDFWALRWYGQAFHEGVGDIRESAKLLFRADISRPQWQRDLLDNILDVNVVGGAYRRYRRLILDRKSKSGETTYTYGSPNQIEQSNLHPVGWCLEAWLNGLDGVVPWQTLGKPRSWTGADQNSLFYPGTVIGKPGPLPSIRLKAFRRGQQDVEYLVLLAAAEKKTQQKIGEVVFRKLNLAGEFLQAQENDAGNIDFQELDPINLWRLRTSVGHYLSEKSSLW